MNNLTEQMEQDQTEVIGSRRLKKHNQRQRYGNRRNSGSIPRQGSAGSHIFSHYFKAGSYAKRKKRRLSFLPQQVKCRGQSG